MRRLVHLVEGLPPDSAFARSEGLWGYTEELLASLIEVEDRYHRWWLSANVKKGTQLPKPVVIERPYKRKKKRKATPEEMRAMFGNVVYSPPQSEQM